VEDLFGIIVFIVIILLSTLGKRKPKPGSGQAARGAARTRPPARTPTPHGTRTPAQPLEAPARPQQGLAGFLELLQGQLEARPPEYATEVPDEIAIEPSFPEAQPLDAASHKEFHDRYVDEERPERITAWHRYHLTPQTARDAVIWTTIFSKPKGLE
jgi:hypothetical protein